MTEPTSTAPDPSTDQLNRIGAQLAGFGVDIDSIPDGQHELAAIMAALDIPTRYQLADLLHARAGGNPNDPYSLKLNDAIDEARHITDIDDARANLDDALTRLADAARLVHNNRARLIEIYDVEHAEGGTDFDTTLQQIGYYVRIATAINPTAAQGNRIRQQRQTKKQAS